MKSKSTPNCTSEAAGLNRPIVVAALIGIIGAAAAVRLCRIGAESVSWDEYTSLTHLGAPNLLEFLRLNRTLDPATLPLYYSIEYLWWHYVDHSVLALRLLSVFLGMLTVPLVYLFGRSLYGRSAGLIAALCFSLSPIHAFHAQGIRMYVLFNLLAVLSAYSFVKMAHHAGARWWVVHGVGNLLLLWTHPFAALILAVEGGFLVLFRLREIRMLLKWIGLHVLLAMPSTVYLMSVRFWPSESTESWIKLPTRLELLGDLIADDVVGLTYQLRISDAAWGFLPKPIAHALAAAHPAFDAAAVLAILACVAGMVWMVFKGAVQRKPMERLAFLVLWVLGPVAALYGASLLFRPCIFPRYTLYASVGLYVLIGGAITALRSWRAQASALAALLVLYGYQIGLVLPGAQRTDWISAGRMIRTQGAAKDPVIIRGQLVEASPEMLTWSSGPLPNPVACAKTFDVLADQAAFLLDQCRRRRTTPDTECGLWAIVVLRAFDVGPCREFETALAARGLKSTVTELDGIERLLVYRVTTTTVTPDWKAREGAVPKETVDGFGDLALALAGKGEYEQALEAVRYVIRMDWVAGQAFEQLRGALERRADIERTAEVIRMFLKGCGFQSNGHLDLAADEFRKAAALDPQNVPVANGLRSVLMEARNYAAALPLFRDLAALNAVNQMVYGHLARAMTQQGDIDAAWEALKLFLKGIDLGESHAQEKMLKAFEKSIEIDPNYGIPYIAFGAVALTRDDGDTCARYMRKGVEVDPDLAQWWGPLVTAMFETKDYDRAWAEVKRLVDSGVELPEPLVQTLRRDSGRSQ